MPGTQTLDALRRDARDELLCLVEHRARDGEDPAEFVPELPSVDELVVRTVLADELRDRGLEAEHALTRLAAASSLPDAAEHAASADRIELELLRDIADRHPELIRAVWALAGRIGG